MKNGVGQREYTKDGKSTWYYQFREGKQKFSQSGFTSHKEALEALDNRKAELRKAQNSKRSVPVKSEHMTIELLTPEFFQHRETTHSWRTVVNERGLAALLAKHFKDRLLLHISVADIQDYVLSCKDRMKNRSINLNLTFLRSFFKFAIQRGYAHDNPAKEVQNLPERGQKTEMWIPSQEEFNKFIKCCHESKHGKHFVPWVYFRAFTGTSPSESYFVEWKDVDFDKGIIRILPKEGNPLKNLYRRRNIPIHPTLRPILLEWRELWLVAKEKRLKRYDGNEEQSHMMKDHNWVFFNPANTAIRSNGYGTAFDNAKKKAGLPQFNPKTLRHFFASTCIMGGADLFTVAKWMGHTNLKMLMETYGHILPDHSAKEMAKIDFGVKAVA